MFDESCLGCHHGNPRVWSKTDLINLNGSKEVFQPVSGAKLLVFGGIKVPKCTLSFDYSSPLPLKKT